MKKHPGISLFVIPRSITRTVDALGKLEKGIEAAIGRVIAEIGINIQREAKQNAPVDFGFLRSSIYLDYKGVGRMGRANINSIGANSNRPVKQLTIPTVAAESNKDGLNAFVGSDMDYAAKMNYKTRFLADAYNKWQPKLKRNIEHQINEQLKKAARL
jgi:hypothetical protein